jgi:transcription-repair coupling factor (superfamily II helicase)
MELQQILERYRDDSRIAELVKILPSAGKASLLHANPSQVAFFAAGFYLKTEASSLFLLPDFEEAAYFENDIRQLLPQGSVLFLPSSYKRDGIFNELDNNRIQQRAQVIDELMRARKAQKVVVTYPEALIEMTVTARTLQENTLHLHVGEKVDVDFMLDLLVEYGFERTDFVYEPGEFSIRGGIIDVFSFGNEYPYRIELFDKEVESMRTFNPETQLSERKISELTIIPNIRTHFTEQHYASFFEFLPEQTVCWIKEPERIMASFSSTWQNIVSEPDNKISDDHPFQGKTAEQLALSPEKIQAEFQQRPCVFSGVYEAPPGGLAIDMRSKPQPSFNRNFQFLINHLQQNHAAEIHTCLLSENLRQLERMRMIFEDLKAAVPWSALNISLSAGFTDEQLGLSLYTDHQIFERFHRYQTKKGFSRGHAITIKALKDLNPGDYVTHIDHGVGVFSGLQRLEINGQIQEAVRIIYADNDILYVNINSLHKISKYSGKEGQVPKVHKLGSDVWPVSYTHLRAHET